MLPLRLSTFHVRSGFVLLGLTVGACTVSPLAAVPDGGSNAASKGRTPITAQVLIGKTLPEDLVTATLASAQKAADDASRRRQIDFFNLHANPVAMRLHAGTTEGTLLSYLGTSKDRTDLNVELRALNGAGSLGFVMNYSGPVTLGKSPLAGPAVTTQGAVGKASGLHFTLMTGLPGNGVTESYQDFLDHLGDLLRQRYGVSTYAFDDVPVVFAVAASDAPDAFLFCNQGSRLVLGERKYADVQAVTALDATGRLLASYALVGFNPKTPGTQQGPTYRVTQDARFGSIVEFGEK